METLGSTMSKIPMKISTPEISLSDKGEVSPYSRRYDDQDKKQVTTPNDEKQTVIKRITRLGEADMSPDVEPLPKKCPDCGNILPWQPNEAFRLGFSKIPWILEECQICHDRRHKEEMEAEFFRTKKDEQERIDSLTGRSRLERKYLNKTFDNFIAREDKTYSTRLAFEECLDYARDFSWHLKRGSGLLILGDTGCGKNHLAAAICHYVIWEHKKTVVVFKELELLRLIKATWNNEIKTTTHELFTLCIETDLLIIHDLGIDIGKDWVRKIYFDILDTRDEKDKPVVFTSNLSFKQLCLSLHQRTASRLKAKFTRIEMWGVPDFREKEGENLRMEWQERRKNLGNELPF